MDVRRRGPHGVHYPAAARDESRPDRGVASVDDAGVALDLDLETLQSSLQSAARPEVPAPIKRPFALTPMMPRNLSSVVAALLGLLPSVPAFAQPAQPALPPAAATRVDFVRDIKPLLEKACVNCHGPEKPKAGQRVDSREAIIKGGESNEAAIVPGHSEKSLIVQYIAGLVPEMEMPPLDKRDRFPALTVREIALMRAWIDQGVVWPEGQTLTAPRSPTPNPVQAATDTTTVTAVKGANEIFARIRNGDTRAIAAALADPSILEVRDDRGNTPLIQAAFYLDAAALDLFLVRGADANAANRAGATALMRGVGELNKVRALLKGGARVDAKSTAGHTALMIACRGHGAAAVVKELLAHGADLHATNPMGANALTAAAETGDAEVVRLLLTHGANANSAVRTPYSTALESALMIAAHYGHEACVRLLLEHGADPRFTSDYGSALHFAAMTNRVAIARLLLDREVDVNLAGRRIVSFRKDFGLTPLMYAAMTERNDPTLVQLLIDRGAKLDARTSGGETALMLARQRGDTRVVAALKAAGASEVERATRPAPTPPRFTPEQIQKATPAVLRTAAESGLAALVQSGARFNDATANRCFTCHQHSLPALARGLAREKGVAYDEAVAAELDQSTVRLAARRIDPTLEEPAPVPSIPAWLLIGLQASAYPSDDVTDSWVYSLARSQSGDGRWTTKAARAPTDYSDVTSTALAIRALHSYAPPTMKRPFQRRIDRATAWLRQVRADSTEERALQILGLHWGSSDRKQLQALSAQLLEQQRADGGWAQLPTMQSDAYATGLSLYALNQGGGIAALHAAYRKGVRYLLGQQRSDGSWLVETRASPVQVAVDNVFAHDTHQWISSSATSWSSMALMLAAAPAKEPRGSAQPRPGED